MGRIHSVVYHRLESPLSPRYGDANGLKSSRRTTLIEVRTDDGVTGWGETFSAAVSLEALRQVSELLHGRDPVDCRPLVEGIRNFNHRIAAGVEIALWDIRGKLAGMSVAQLLGGAFRVSQPAYASLQNVSEDADVTASAVRVAEAAIGLGYTSLKMKIGWHRPDIDLTWIEAVLDALPETVHLAIDANRALDMPTAKFVCRSLRRPERIMWFEEPLSKAWPEAYRELRQSTGIAIAGAESMDGAMINDVVARRAMDIINPDLCGHGGLGPMQRMHGLCDIHGVKLVPHIFDGQLIRLATLHLLASQPNWTERQSVFAAAPVECDVSPNPLRDDLFDWAPRPDASGCISVPTTPGLGVSVDQALLAKYSSTM